MSVDMTFGFQDFRLHQKLQDYLQKRQVRLFRNLDRELEKISPFKVSIDPMNLTPDPDDDFVPSASYTDTLQLVVMSYKGSGYRLMNRIVRVPDDPEVQLTTNDDPSGPSYDKWDRRNNVYILRCYIDAVLFAFITRYGPTAPVDMMLYRGLSLPEKPRQEFIDKMKIGSTVTNREFLSVTPRWMTAQDFATGQSFYEGVYLILQIPKGTPMYVFTFHLENWEPETVLPNCTRWVIDDVKTKKIVKQFRDYDDYGGYYTYTKTFHSTLIYMHLTDIGRMKYEAYPGLDSFMETSQAKPHGGTGKHMVRTIQKYELIAMQRFILYRTVMNKYFFESDAMTPQQMQIFNVCYAMLKKTYEKYGINGGCSTFEDILGHGLPTTLLKKIAMEKAIAEGKKKPPVKKQKKKKDLVLPKSDSPVMPAMPPMPTNSANITDSDPRNKRKYVVIKQLKRSRRR